MIAFHIPVRNHPDYGDDAKRIAENRVYNMRAIAQAITKNRKILSSHACFHQFGIIFESVQRKSKYGKRNAAKKQDGIWDYGIFAHIMIFAHPSGGGDQDNQNRFRLDQIMAAFTWLIVHDQMMVDSQVFLYK